MSSSSIASGQAMATHRLAAPVASITPVEATER